jgi:hypothetical protein
MGIGVQDSTDLPGGRSAESQPLPTCDPADPADVLLDAGGVAEGIHHSRILRRQGVSDAMVPSSPVRAIAVSGLAGVAKSTPDLVPTTFKMMGNVLYLHTPTGKVLMEVGNVSPSDLGTKLDLGAIKAIGNEASRSGSNQINLVNKNEDQLFHAIEDSSVIRTPKSDLGDHKDASEVLARANRRGYKQRVRNQTVKIEPEHNYSPGEVAAALNLSYDSALRRMPKMKGVVDFGTPTRRYKRGKRKLRISGRNLLAYLRTKTVM